MTDFETINRLKRDKIIEMALIEFAEKGYSQSSTNSIVKNAQISKGSLFKYFPKKSDLYIYLMSYGVEKLERGVYGEEVVGETWMDKLLSYAANEYDFLIKEPLIAKFLQRVYVDVGQTDDPAIQNAFNEKVVACLSSTHEIIGLDSQKDALLIDHINFIVAGFNQKFHLVNHAADLDTNQKELYLNGMKEHLMLIRY